MPSPSAETRLAVLEEKIRALRAEIKVQAAEYRRRLDELNHAHSLAAARNSEFISREVFENRSREVDTKYGSIMRLVYVGIGIVLALQFFIGVAFVIWNNLK